MTLNFKEFYDDEGLEFNCLFVDTENTFRQERIK